MANGFTPPPDDQFQRFLARMSGQPGGFLSTGNMQLDTFLSRIAGPPEIDSFSRMMEPFEVGAPDRLVRGLPPTPFEEEEGMTLGAFMGKAGRMAKRFGKEVVRSVNVFEEDISTRERLARAATIGSFFIPFGGTAKLLGVAGKALPRVLLTAGQEALVGGGIAAIRGDSVVSGATFGALVGGGLQAIATRAATHKAAAAANVLREAVSDARAAFSRAEGFTDLARTPLHNVPYVIIRTARADLPLGVGKVKKDTIKALQELGYDPVPVIGSRAEAAGRVIDDDLLVPGVSEQEALKIARRLNADEVITPNAVYNLRDNTRRSLVKSRTKFNSSINETEDYVGVLDIGNETHAFAFTFGDDVEEIAARAAGPTTPEERVLSLIGTPPSFGQRFVSRLRNLPGAYRFQQWYQDIVDSNFGFRRAEQVLGFDPSDADSLAKMAQLMRGWASVAEHSLKYGLVAADDPSRILRPGLFEIFAKVKPEDWDSFKAYGLARRLKAVAEDTGKKLPLLDSGERLTMAELDAVIQNAPQYFHAVFDEVVDWRNTLLREYLGKTGILSDSAVAAILSSRDYVPLRQALEELVSRTPLGRADDFFGIFDPIQRLHGVQGKLQDWTEVLVRETLSFTQLAEHQKVLTKLVQQLEAADPEIAAIFAKRIDLPPRELSKAKKQIIASIQDSDPALAEAVQNLDEEILALLAPEQLTGSRHVIGTLIDGKRVWYEIKDPMLWAAIRAMRPAERNWFEKILTAKPITGIASMLRAGATLSLEFIARNPVRDVLFAGVTSGAKAGDFLSGIASAFKADEWFRKWTAAGGPRAALVSLDRNVLRREFLRATGLGEGAESSGVRLISNVIKHPIDALRAASELMETGTRLGHFKKVAAELQAEGWEPGAALREAALRSRNVSVDFAVSGAKTAALRQTVAFWNAMIQGYRTTVQKMATDPSAWARAIAGITMPSIVLYGINRRDPEYFDLPAWERAIFWHFKIGDTWVRVPKPFEIGLIFGSLPEKMLEAIDREQPELLDQAFADQAADMARDLMPIPTALRPLLERAINFDLFKQRPVVPRSLQDIDPAFRELPGTTALAKHLVRFFDLGSLGIDPVTVDHVMFGYTGGLGRTVSDLGGWFISMATGAAETPGQVSIGPVKLQTEPENLPLVRGFVSRFPYGNEAAERFYRFAEDTQTAANTAARLERELRIDDLTDFIERRAGHLAFAPPVRQLLAQLSELRQVRRSLETDPMLSGRAKQELIDELLDLEYKLVRDLGPLEELAEGLVEQ